MRTANFQLGYPSNLAVALRTRRSVLALSASLFFVALYPAQTPNDQVQLQLNTEESEAVLAIVGKHKAAQAIEQSDWQRLFSSEPYVRLKKREAELHRNFTDEQFKQFAVSDELAQRVSELQRTLQEWKNAGLKAAAVRVLAYLPADARIRAKVFPVIKPQTNSFVYEPTTDPTIFLYLDPKLTWQQFENTVAHEMHHIGYSSIGPRLEKQYVELTPNVRAAVEWMGAFGEGFAMLAAAGGPDVDPHKYSLAEARGRWQHDMANFNQDLKRLEEFFLDILDGRLKTKEEINKAGFSFFGIQGPWYTVGYKMAVIVEKRYGRPTLVRCMEDPSKLLATYDQVAAEENQRGGEQQALWSAQLLQKIGAQQATREPQDAVTK